VEIWKIGRIEDMRMKVIGRLKKLGVYTFDIYSNNRYFEK
jgi:hypothetical protein